VSFCRVPSPGFSQAPRDSLPAHLCRFAVRSPRHLDRGFSWRHGFNRFMGRSPSSSHLGLEKEADLPASSAYVLEPGIPTPGRPALPRPPFSQTMSRRYGNIDPFSIAYAFRPRLRDRLTLRRLALLRKPWACGERVFHPLYRYSCQHNPFRPVHASFRSRFDPGGMLPYRSPKRRSRGFGGALEPRYIFGADSLDQ
jgi:hypothetical protein